MRPTTPFTILAILACGTSLAQQANVNLDYNPQKNTENLVPFTAPLSSPDVRDDRTVTFRLKAPEARRVELAGVAILTALGQGRPVPFAKGADGVWSLTIGPLRPDMYVYHLVVDGVQVADPNNTVAGFTAMPPYSQLVVHGDGPAYYDARDVPHGAVTRHVYHSGVTNGERELYVYTPPGYDRAKTYPVLYLVGGSGDLPHNWIYDGRVNFILDNLLAEGKAVPMVIAIPNNQVLHRSHPRHVDLTFDAFERELRQHVIPLVEKQYSVRTDPGGRALSGLSMGGRHTMFVGLRSLDLFASFGVLSAGDTQAESSLAGFLNDPDVNAKVQYLFVGQGTEEAKGRLGQRCVALHEALETHGVRHEYYVGGPGGHDWATWRHLVHARFLPGLWRGDLAQGSRPLLASVFQDHAVLQRGRPLTVWGHATPSDTVTVGLNGQRATATADASGRWSVRFPAIEAGGPFTLEARSGAGTSQTLSDLLVGDVWLCSGQSNMELPVSRARGGLLVAARSADERLRLLTVPHSDRVEPAEDLPAGAVWQLAAPDTVRGFSAACYFAARELRETVDVPLGLVVSAWGGSAAEAWTAESGLRAAGGFDDRLDLLRLYAKDEAAAHQRMGRLWEDWWRTHARSRTEPWQVEAARTGAWLEVPEPMRSWKTWDVPQLARHDGMIWYRRTVRLTAEQAGRPATLSLGAIDEVDQTWVNGRAIRNTFGWGTERTYELPPGVLRPGENVIVVNVLSTWDAGGMTGPAEALALTFDDGTKAALGGGWLYQAVPLEIGRPPRAPWESVAGLTTLYNGMIAPIGRFGVRGAVWYQGETNADAPSGYQAILAGLMAGWRAQLGADLPFVIVQLPGFGPAPTAPVESGWSEIREAQRLAVAADPHAALVVTIDLGERDDIHPANKRDVGRRIARAARHLAYGETVAPSGPAARSAAIEPGRVVVTIGDVVGRLLTGSSNQAIGFELCGAAAGTCRFASATLEGDRAIIPFEGPPPARLRFSWGDSPVVNLWDASGLPVGPFEITLLRPER